MNKMMYARILLSMSLCAQYMSATSRASQLTVAQAYDLATNAQLANAHPALDTIIRALEPHRTTNPNAHFPQDIETQLTDLIGTDAAQVSQLTVSQAHDFLQKFLQEHPDHPHKVELEAIMQRLEPHLDENPDAHFQQSVENELLNFIKGPTIGWAAFLQRCGIGVAVIAGCLMLYKLTVYFLDGTRTKNAAEKIEQEVSGFQAQSQEIKETVQVVSQQTSSMSAGLKAAQAQLTVLEQHGQLLAQDNAKLIQQRKKDLTQWKRDLSRLRSNKKCTLL